MFVVYLILFLVAVIASVVFSSGGSLEIKKHNQTNARLAIMTAFIIVFTFLGFRYNVGRDYINYVGDYKNIDSSDFGAVFSYYKYEYGYLVLLHCARLLDTGPQGIFVLSSFILFLLYFNLFKKRWNLLPTSLFVFFIGTPYVFSINGIRQAIAIMAFLNAINSLVDGPQLKRFLSFLIWMAFGTLFHTSLIFFLPCFIFQFEKVVSLFNAKLLILIALTGFALNVIGVSSELLPNQELLGTEGYSYGTALDNDRFVVEESVLSIGNVFHLCLILIPLFLYDKVKRIYPKMRVFFVTFALGSTIFFLFTDNMFTQRISYYCLFSELLVYPIVCLFSKTHKTKINWWLVCAIMYLMLFLVEFSGFWDNQLYPNASIWGIRVN